MRNKERRVRPVAAAFVLLAYLLCAGCASSPTDLKRSPCADFCEYTPLTDAQISGLEGI